LLAIISLNHERNQQNNFTVIDNNNGTNHFINGVSMALDTVDNKIIRLLPASTVQDKTDTLKISYDGINGTIRSVYDVKASSFSEKAIVNRYLDPSLLVKKMQINLSTDNHPSGLSAWTDVNLSTRYGNTSNSVTYRR